MSDKQIITLSGDLGSGKSTVARLLASRLDLKLYSTGDIQRSMAARMGMTSLELNKLSEIDPSIDEKIDRSVTELARKEDRLLLDSRLAWHFAGDSFNVYLTVDPLIAAQRIFAAGRGPVEQYESLAEASRQIEARRESETRRFDEYYGIKAADLRNFHLVVDTTELPPETVVEFIEAKWRIFQNEPNIPRLGVSPRNLFPCESVSNLNPERIQVLLQSFKPDASLNSDSHQAFLQSLSNELSAYLEISVIRAGRYFFIFSGHEEVSTAIAAQRDLIPVNTIYQDDNLLPNGEIAKEYARSHCSAGHIRDWEEAHQFRFASVPPYARSI